MLTKRGKARLIFIFSTNTNCENMAYRSFRSEKCSARGVRKVTTGITSLGIGKAHPARTRNKKSYAVPAIVRIVSSVHLVVGKIVLRCWMEGAPASFAVTKPVSAINMRFKRLVVLDDSLQANRGQLFGSASLSCRCLGCTCIRLCTCSACARCPVVSDICFENGGRPRLSRSPIPPKEAAN